MSVSYRQHPELATPAITRPCSACGHQVSRYRWDLCGLTTCANCEENGAIVPAATVPTKTRLKMSGPGSMTSAKEDAIAAAILDRRCVTEIERLCATGRLTVYRVAKERGLSVVCKHGKSRALRIKRSKAQRPEHVAVGRDHRQTSSGVSTMGGGAT